MIHNIGRRAPASGLVRGAGFLRDAGHQEDERYRHQEHDEEADDRGGDPVPGPRLGVEAPV